MSSFTTQMIEAVALGESHVCPFGDDAVDWQYVEDVSRSIVLACTCPTTQTRVFNVKGGIRPVKDGVAYLKTLVPEAQITRNPEYSASHGIMTQRLSLRRWGSRLTIRWSKGF